MTAIVWNTSSSQTVRPTSYWGQSGFFTVPQGWALRYEIGQQFTSPNADFSYPKYACYTNEVGALVFMDLIRSRSMGHS